MRQVPALVFLVLGLVATALACHPAPSNRLPLGPPEEDTSLGPGDVFEVRVLGEPDLTRRYQVGADGTILLPFVGVMEVAGKHADDVAHEIGQRLKDGQYLLNPQVTVFVEQTNSKRVTIVGAVARPGTLAMVPGLTVIQAVSNCGGFSNLASKDDTVVTRRVNGKLERYRIPVSEITRGNVEDIPLRSGDIIFVPERVF